MLKNIYIKNKIKLIPVLTCLNFGQTIDQINRAKQK